MEKPTSALLLLAFISFSGVRSQTNLYGNAFVFPSPSADSYVLLRPSLKEPLRNFTACLRFFTDLTRAFALLSASSRQHDNEILLFVTPQEYEVFVGGQLISFWRNLERTDGRWESLCAAWDSTTGIVQLWVDGQPLPRKGLAKGYRVPTDLVMMLGQEQDSYGGSLDAGQAFVGEMAEVYLWNTVLPPQSLRKIQRDAVTALLVDWAALDFETKGYVVMEPVLH